MTNIFTASETPPEKKRALLFIFLFTHSIHLLTKWIPTVSNCGEKNTFRSTLGLSTQPKDQADSLDLSKQVQPLS